MIEIVRLHPDCEDTEALHRLILDAFAFMDGVIDPPSSAHRLTPVTLRQKIADEIAFAAMENGQLLGCIFCRPEPGCLYVGKLAVSPLAQGRGIGARLLATAEDTARALNLPALRLETRIELVANHARFGAWGFVKTAETSHPGFSRVTAIEMTKHLS